MKPEDGVNLGGLMARAQARGISPDTTAKMVRAYCKDRDIGLRDAFEAIARAEVVLVGLGVEEVEG